MVPWGEVGQLSPDPNVITFVMGQLGVVGALVWYLWYQTSREMPKARTDFLTALTDCRKVQTDHDDQHSKDWQRVGADIHLLTLAVQDLADSVREALELRRPKRPNPPGASPP